MATVVEPGGVGPGPLGPVDKFRFLHRELIKLCDGQHRILQPDVDYPADMPYEVLQRRLKLMIRRQQGRIAIWRDEEGQIHVVMSLPWGRLDT
jgi:hypothetical protein